MLSHIDAKSEQARAAHFADPISPETQIQPDMQNILIIITRIAKSTALYGN